MPDDVRADLLWETVLKLKSMVPKTFHEAWYHPDENFRKRWRAAIMKELDSMTKCKVWKVEGYQAISYAQESSLCKIEVGVRH